VKTYGVFYPKFSESDFYAYLKESEVVESQRIKSMSYGQQKKVLIAFALATHVSTLIVDEPTTVWIFRRKVSLGNSSPPH
jgi:ABC-2 type transport system ATP-binding protein